MPTIKADTLRSVATWLLFAGAILAALMSGQRINATAQLYGSSYPAAATPQVPAFTSAVLPLIDFILFLSWIVVVAASIFAAAAYKLVDDRTTREHVITLISAIVYYLVFMAWSVFVTAYFYLPMLRVGI
jgi:hypothetical protein